MYVCICSSIGADYKRYIKTKHGVLCEIFRATQLAKLNLNFDARFANNRYNATNKNSKSSDLHGNCRVDLRWLEKLLC